MSTPKKKSPHDAARLSFRVASDIKDRVTRAAEISGQSVSDFACSALAREADEILARYDLIRNGA